MLFNAAVMGLPTVYRNARISGFQRVTDERFANMDRRSDAIDWRFDEMRDLRGSELDRVEEVL